MNRKTVLISGAYRGLGFQTAKGLAAKGFHVYVSARKKADGDKAVKSILDAGHSAEFIPMDVTVPQSVAAAVALVSRTTDRLDVLINNAAIYPDPTGSILNTTAELMARAYESNTIAPVLVSQAFLSLLLKSRDARIVNVSSGAGALENPQTFAPAYSLSKTALNAVTIHLAAALKDKVAVNSVCPGWVRTEMGGANAPRSVEEGADSIVWLASEAPATLTGRFIRDRSTIPW